VFVTKDAKDLRERLAGDRASPVSYDADKHAALLEEDKAIEKLSLGLRAGDLAVISADRVFLGGG
jgi:zinc protease